MTSARRRTAVAPAIGARIRGLSFEARAAMLICVLAAVPRLLALNGFSADYDEGVYWQSLRAMAHGYPLFTQIFSSQPPFFLLAIYPFYALFGQTLAAARFGIAVWSLVGIVAIYFAGRALAGRWCGLLACALLAADPLYLRESHTLQAEAPSVALMTLCVAFAATAMRSSQGRGRRALTALAGVAFGLGMLTKLWDVVAIVPAALLLTQPFWATLVYKDGHLRQPRRAALLAGARQSLPDILWFAAGALAALIAVLLPFIGAWSTLYDQAVRFHVAAGSAVNRGLRYNLRLISQDGNELPIVLVALTSVALAVWRRAWIAAPVALWLVASLVVLIQQQPLLDHHVTLLAPPLALLAGLALPLLVKGSIARRSMPHPYPAMRKRSWLGGRIPSPLPSWGKGRERDLARVVVALAGLALLICAVLSVLETSAARAPVRDAQIQMAIMLRLRTTPSDLVASDDQYITALADRDVPPQLVDTSQVRIASGYLTATQLERIITRSDTRVILFASGRFDLVPGFRQWVDQSFTKIADFGGGRALYMKLATGPVIA